MSSATDAWGDPRTADYLTAARAALADLPAGEREELLEDLAGHLAEVAADADADTPLADSLGTPEAYAAELRASAGLGAAAPGAGRRARAAGRLTAAGGFLRRQPAAAAVLRFLPELRPAWWVLRGYLLAVVATVVVSDVDFAGPVPADGSTALVFVVLALAAVVGSVWWGRRSREHHRVVRYLDATAGVLLVLVGFAAWFGAVSRVDDGGEVAYASDPPRTIVVVATVPEGQPPPDIRVYDEQDGYVVLPRCPDGWPAVLGPDAGKLEWIVRGAPPGVRCLVVVPAAPSVTPSSAPSPAPSPSR